MGIVFKNNAKTTLGSSLTNSATSATVTDGSVFPSLAAGEFFFCTFDDGTNNEIVKVTARSSNTLTIVRAQESTTARAFSSGDAAELRLTAGVLETIQENIAAKSANQTVFNATTSGGATSYDIGIDPGVEGNAMVFLNGVLQHHNTISFSSSTLTFDAAPPNGMALEVIVDNLINLQSSNLTVDSFTAADVGGSAQTDFTLSDTPAAETNLIVFVDGVFQDQDAYTISNNTLTITTGVIAGRGVTVYVINPVNIGTPSDGTITSAKLSGNITMPGTLTVGSNDVAFDSPTFVVDNSNSRVGLGTASPSVPVDIVGDVKMSANLTVDTSTLVVDSSNNRVGIGTSSPAHPLNVVNSSELQAEFSGYSHASAANNARAGSGSIRLGSGVGTTGLLLDYTDQGQTVGLIKNEYVANATSELRLQSPFLSFYTGTSAAERWRIDSTGHLTGAAGSKIVQTIASSGGNFLEVTHSGNEAWSMAVQSGTGADDYLDIGINGGTRAISIHEDGKIGIGTASPNAKLDILGTTSDQLRLRTAESEEYKIGRNSSTGFLDFHGTQSSYTGYTFGGVDGERMRINASGNLFLGTTDSTTVGSPDRNFTIGSTTNNQEVALTLNVIEGSNNRRCKFFLDDNAGNFGLSNTASSGVCDFVIEQGGTEVFNIDQNGLVTKPRISAANGAFWARGTSNPTASGNTHVGVVFTTLEQGGGYSTSTGRYTAPVAGWYSFSTNVRIDGYTGGGFMRIAFYTGTSPTTSQSGYGQGHAIYGPDSLDDQYYSMTTSWTVYLGSGNQVGVAVLSGNSGGYTIHQESNFSGHLIG